MKNKEPIPWGKNAAAIGIGAMIAGCATHPVATVGAGTIDAYVHGDYQIEKDLSDRPQCLRKMPSSELEKIRLVKVSYRASGSQFRTFTVAEAPKDGFAQAGVHVELIPGDCRKGNLATIVRPLYAHPPS
ncbi:hypothetical protein [Herbaspirillum sp. RV1423]|uniref:hypothetical protein n=1 Tax=Herbaspirillum sp. RV1423 TaxID=1443993 RepID=UPI0004BA9E4C|nr:hypothetical protein [Herbaspirillum sp. RV1423]